MRLENSFAIPAGVDAAWELLMDVPRVVPCMPGAELVETVSDTEWKARLAAKLGPIALLFNTDVRREGADEAERVVTLCARARDVRGRGQADATIRSALVVTDGETRVDIQTDLMLSGSIARFGRASVVEDMASQLVGEFAAALQAELEPAPTAPAADGPAAQPNMATSPAAGPAARPGRSAAPRPVSGTRLLLNALRSALRRWLGRPAERI